MSIKINDKVSVENKYGHGHASWSNAAIADYERIQQIVLVSELLTTKTFLSLEKNYETALQKC